MKKMKKGFTIVELVIVIAVIGILAAVLIPTFSSVIKKSKVSSDQQAIRQMNTVLAAEGVMEDVDIFDVFEVLEEGGLSAKAYKALSAGMSFFWDSEINRVLYVDSATGKATYPEEYKDRANNGKWFSLTMQIESQKPADTDYADKKVTVDSGKELAYVISKDVKEAKVNEIVLSSNVDMMGAAFDAGEIKNSLTITGTEGSPAIIKNATTVEAKKTYGVKTEGMDGVYNAAMFALVASGKTLTIKNVVIENLNVKDLNAGNCAFLVGQLSGNLVLENVTIRNSSIIGHHAVGALVGNFAGGSLTVKNVTIENVTVEAVGGRVGSLIGFSNGNRTITGADEITMTNVTTGIYDCEFNTGSYDGETLGLANGVVTSTEVENDGMTTVKGRVYFENALIGNISSDGAKAGTSAPAELSADSALAKLYNAVKGLVK